MKLKMEYQQLIFGNLLNNQKKLVSNNFCHILSNIQ
jgi:hypothetical protein